MANEQKQQEPLKPGDAPREVKRITGRVKDKESGEERNLTVEQLECPPKQKPPRSNPFPAESLQYAMLEHNEKRLTDAGFVYDGVNARGESIWVDPTGSSMRGEEVHYKTILSKDPEKHEYGGHRKVVQLTVPAIPWRHTMTRALAILDAREEKARGDEPSLADRLTALEQKCKAQDEMLEKVKSLIDSARTNSKLEATQIRQNLKFASESLDEFRKPSEPKGGPIVLDHMNRVVSRQEVA